MAMSLHGLGSSVAIYSRQALTGLLPESPYTKSRDPAWTVTADHEDEES